MALGRTNINLPEIPIKPKAVYLYKEGDECTDISGGWKIMNRNATYNTTTKNADSIVLKSTTGYASAGAAVVTTNLIDVTNHNTLRILFDCDANSLERSSLDFRFVSNGSSWSNAWNSLVVGGSITPVDTNLHTGIEMSVDLSTTNGEYYLFLTTYTNTTVTIREVWLE